MRISDWSSYVCSSDLTCDNGEIWHADFREDKLIFKSLTSNQEKTFNVTYDNDKLPGQTIMFSAADDKCYGMIKSVDFDQDSKTELPDCVYSINRSEEHTSELQSLMRISYADFCLKTNTSAHNLT